MNERDLILIDTVQGFRLHECTYMLSPLMFSRRLSPFIHRVGFKRVSTISAGTCQRCGILGTPMGPPEVPVLTKNLRPSSLRLFFPI